MLDTFLFDFIFLALKSISQFAFRGIIIFENMPLKQMVEYQSIPKESDLSL